VQGAATWRIQWHDLRDVPLSICSDNLYNDKFNRRNVTKLQVTNVVAKMVAKLQDQPTRCHLWTPVFVMLQPDTRTKSNTLLTVAGMRYLFVRTVSRDYSLPSWLSGENHCAVVCTACVAVRSRRSRVQIQARWLVSACRSTKCIFRE